jgi:plastocyanin
MIGRAAARGGFRLGLLAVVLLVVAAPRPLGAVAPAREIAVSARSYRFTPSKLRLQAREKVVIVLHSKDAFHDFVVDGRTVVSAGGGKTARGALRLIRRGQYTFACAVPGHAAAGMRGTITVS